MACDHAYFITLWLNFQALLCSYKLLSVAIFCALIFVFSISTIVQSILRNADLTFYIGNPSYMCSIVDSSGVTRLLLMPGQATYTHAAHIHMSIFIWTSVFFSKYVAATSYSVCKISILAIYSNDQSPSAWTIQFDTNFSYALIPD